MSGAWVAERHTDRLVGRSAKERFGGYPLSGRGAYAHKAYANAETEDGLGRRTLIRPQMDVTNRWARSPWWRNRNDTVSQVTVTACCSL